MELLQSPRDAAVDLLRTEIIIFHELHFIFAWEIFIKILQCYTVGENEIWFEDFIKC